MRTRGILYIFIIFLLNEFSCYRIDFDYWAGTSHLTRKYFDKYNVKILDDLEMRHLGIIIIDEDAFTNMVELKFLHLNQNNIRYLPENVFSNLTSLELLNLKYNKLQNLDENLFKNLTKLTFIDLSKNNIKKIHKNLFMDLRNLEFLYLNYNEIPVLEPGTFQNNMQLQYIDLYKNELTELKNGTFTNLSKLKRLYFNINKINNIELNAFPINSSLNEITLYMNNLQYLDHNIILNLKTLKYLSLYKNPWNCNKKLKNLINASKNLLPGSQPFNEMPSCATPKRLENRTWNTLTDADFPFINASTTNNASVGDKVMLSCRGVNIDNGVYTTSIEWLYEDNTPVLETLETNGRLVSFKYVHINDVVWNNLTIQDAQQEDARGYKCVMRDESEIMEEKSLQLSLEVQPLVSDITTRGYGKVTS